MRIANEPSNERPSHVKFTNFNLKDKTKDSDEKKADSGGKSKESIALVSKCQPRYLRPLVV